MADQYKQIFSLKPNLYTKGAPILISSGALLRSISSDNLFVRLELRNICPKVIRQVSVRITPLDMQGRPVGLLHDFIYPDFHAVRDEYFASYILLSLSVKEAVGFQVSVTQIVTDKGMVWRGRSLWDPMPPTRPLIALLQDPAYVRFYQSLYGSYCHYVPRASFDLWMCSCGQFNHHSEQHCHVCGNAFQEMTTALEGDFLSRKIVSDGKFHKLESTGKIRLTHDEEAEKPVRTETKQADTTPTMVYTAPEETAPTGRGGKHAAPSSVHVPWILYILLIVLLLAILFEFSYLLFSRPAQTLSAILPASAVERLLPLLEQLPPPMPMVQWSQILSYIL